MPKKPKVFTYEVELEELIKRRSTITVQAADAQEAREKAEAYDGAQEIHDGTESIESNRAIDAILCEQ